MKTIDQEWQKLAQTNAAKSSSSIKIPQDYLSPLIPENEFDMLDPTVVTDLAADVWVCFGTSIAAHIQ